MYYTFISYFQVADIVSLHDSVCPQDHERKIQLSCDGISENKSTSTSIDIYSICFKNCKTIYPHKLVRPLGKSNVDHRKHLEDVLKDIQQYNLTITQYIGDNPKRSMAKECKCFSAWYPCEYCFGKGSKIELRNNSKARENLIKQQQLIQEQIVSYQEKISTPENELKIQQLQSLYKELQKSINALKKKSNILWPASTMNAQHRSRQSILEIVEKLEKNEIHSIDDCKGIMGRSLLLDIPNFNFVYDSPAEYLHSNCLGVTKRLVELTFSVGKNRPRNTKRKLTSPKKFELLMMKIKVVKEFGRRARKLDFAVYKGQEFRNLTLFFFPVIVDCLEKDAREKELWLLLAYMVRSAVIPTEEFSNIDINAVNQSCSDFYHLYEMLFSPHNCTYNVHVFLCHLMEIRTHGPLTETSAFKFEAFYGEVRRSFVPGTPSTTKQILKNIFLKRYLRKHCCASNIFLSNYDTSLECNKLIYCYTQKQYNFYEIKEIEGTKLKCQKIGKYQAVFEDTPQINWASVGVFRKGGVCSTISELDSSQVKGKVLLVGKYMITCPYNVLNEK